MTDAERLEEIRARHERDMGGLRLAHRRAGAERVVHGLCGACGLGTLEMEETDGMSRYFGGETQYGLLLAKGR